MFSFLPRSGLKDPPEQISATFGHFKRSIYDMAYIESQSRNYIINQITVYEIF